MRHTSDGSPAGNDRTVEVDRWISIGGQCHETPHIREFAQCTIKVNATILPGLPGDGPAPIYFYVKEPSPWREGLAVRLQQESAADFVGNFQCGQREYSGATVWEDGGDLCGKRVPVSSSAGKSRNVQPIPDMGVSDCTPEWAAVLRSTSTDSKRAVSPVPATRQDRVLSSIRSPRIQPVRAEAQT